MTTLSVSIVTHDPDLALLRGTLQSLGGALHAARAARALRSGEVVLVDNGPGGGWAAPLRALVEEVAAAVEGFEWRLLSGHGNVGYGRGHNLAIAGSRGIYHLVLNPDVRLEEDAILEALAYLGRHPDVGLVAPAVVGASGEPEYLCKRYPSVTDLLVRGFVPRRLQRPFRGRLARYEMRDVLGAEPREHIPLVSGCFMLLRREVLERVEGFSPRYHLYFEDFDLSLRVAEHAGIAYVPSVRIVHYGGYAARKGWRHILMFARSASAFFHAHGWKWW